jgi:hypothetical protein
MRRTARILAALALAALGCQDYNFNPVGHCLIQPGTTRVRLSDTSTADVLFVVDDSGSMKANQDNLAGGFSVFIANLNAENVNRVSHGLEPIDFHIAITTTAIFQNTDAGAVCQASCGGATNVCCITSTSQPLQTARTCSGAGAACSAGNTCRNDCQQAPGAFTCCSSTGVPELVPVPCTAAEVGSACGDLRLRYPSTCTTFGAGTPYALWPSGNFVRAAGTSNPLVLHFDKQLYTAGGPGTNLQGYTSAQLQTFFQQNVVVGVCGSGQEQGLEAGRIAIEKALAGAQPGVAASEWPHAGAKLVVVYIGDEDDCSSPEDPVTGVILSGSPGLDTCVNDAAGKEYATSSFVSFLTGLKRPLGAGFVVGTSSATCVDLDGVTACDASTDACAAAGLGAPGKRFLLVGNALKSAGADVVAGAVCAPSPDYFGPVLDRIADIVKPPSVLTLPTVPASDQVALLRIVDKNGYDFSPPKICSGPAPSGSDPSTACGGGPCDWWFVASTSPTTRTPTIPTNFVYIDHTTNHCEANPGESYSLDYLGRVPDQNGCTTADQCAAAMGGTAADWNCVVPVAGQPGTCLCAP